MIPSLNHLFYHIHIVRFCLWPALRYVAYRDETGKGHSFVAANAPWAPFALLFALTTFWAVTSPNDILQLHPRMFYYMCGTIFANVTCKLIIAQVFSPLENLQFCGRCIIFRCVLASL